MQWLEEMESDVRHICQSTRTGWQQSAKDEWKTDGNTRSKNIFHWKEREEQGQEGMDRRQRKMTNAQNWKGLTVHTASVNEESQ